MDSTEVNRDDDATSDDGATAPAGHADADRLPEPAHPTDPDREPETPGSGLGPEWQPV